MESNKLKETLRPVKAAIEQSFQRSMDQQLPSPVGNEGEEGRRQWDVLSPGGIFPSL